LPLSPPLPPCRRIVNAPHSTGQKLPRRQSRKIVPPHFKTWPQRTQRSQRKAKTKSKYEFGYSGKLASIAQTRRHYHIHLYLFSSVSSVTSVAIAFPVRLLQFENDFLVGLVAGAVALENILDHRLHDGGVEHARWIGSQDLGLADAAVDFDGQSHPHPAFDVLRLRFGRILRLYFLYRLDVAEHGRQRLHLRLRLGHRLGRFLFFLRLGLGLRVRLRLRQHDLRLHFVGPPLPHPPRPPLDFPPPFWLFLFPPVRPRPF